MKRSVVEEIRQPLALRLYIAVFGLVWCGVLVVGLVTALINKSPAVLVIVIMLAFGGLLIYRGYRLSVEVGNSELVVRNYYRTHHIRREDIEGFRVGPIAFQPLVRAIHVLTRGDEVVPLDVTIRPTFWRRGRDSLERHLEELRSWSASS